MSIDPDPVLAGRTARWPQQSRVATTALVLGILAIPFGLLVYPGVLLGASAVLFGVAGLIITRGGRALGTALAGLVALTIALSLGWQGLRTIHDCEDRLGHRPDHTEIETCVRDGL